MRSLLFHERALIELLIKDNSRVPRDVFKILRGPESAINIPFVLNQTFTLFFCNDTSKNQLSLVNCDIGIPCTIGNELLLVEMIPESQLAFLEFMGPTFPDKAVLAPYVRTIADYCRSLGTTNEFTALSSELAGYFCGEPNTQATYRGKLAEARLLILKSRVFFYLGTSASLLLAAPEQSSVTETDLGVVQQLQLDNDIAIEGWLYIERQ